MIGFCANPSILIWFIFQNKILFVEEEFTMNGQAQITLLFMKGLLLYIAHYLYFGLDDAMLPHCLDCYVFSVHSPEFNVRTLLNFDQILFWTQQSTNSSRYDDGLRYIQPIHRRAAKRTSIYERTAIEFASAAWHSDRMRLRSFSLMPTVCRKEHLQQLVVIKNIDHDLKVVSNVLRVKNFCFWSYLPGSLVPIWVIS